MKRFWKVIKITLVALVTLLLLVFIISLFAPRSNKIAYGVTFSAPYAQSLGLDWKQTYLAILDDLKAKNLRLSAYWDNTEPQQSIYDFSTLDFQINEASKRGDKMVVAVGRRLPRWPECHDPSWIINLNQAQLDKAQLDYVQTVVQRYKNNSNIDAWQVENEPFLSTFGICPKLDKSLLDSEISLVKSLDPNRPIIITDSGELSFWFYSGNRGDIFGSTFYRYVFSDIFHRYWTNHIPSLYYRFKAGLLRLMHPGKQVVIMELEAEPWTTGGIASTSIDDQFKTMSIGNFNSIVNIAASTGFSPQYLWGAEWWFWMKDHGHPEFLEKAKTLMAQ